MRRLRDVVNRLDRTLVAGVLLSIGALLPCACFSKVATIRCFEWAESEECPTREDALATELDDVDEVTSDGTYWPAHGYTVNGVEIPIAAECCYEVEVTTRTTELH